jgi:hypothetical protein
MGELAFIRPAPGHGLLVEGAIVGETWPDADLAVLAGGPGGLLVSDGDNHFTLTDRDADPVEVVVPASLAAASFAALSPDLGFVVASQKGSTFLVDLTSGDAVRLEPAVANPLRYVWLPDGSALVWIERGRVWMIEPGSADAVELGPATVAISYGSLAVLEQ